MGGATQPGEGERVVFLDFNFLDPGVGHQSYLHNLWTARFGSCSVQIGPRSSLIVDSVSDGMHRDGKASTLL